MSVFRGKVMSPHFVSARQSQYRLPGRMAFTRPTSLPPNRRVGTWVQQRPRGADIR